MAPGLTAPAVRSPGSLEYLLLGDLLEVLEEVPSIPTSRWLLAILDRLLALLLAAGPISGEETEPRADWEPDPELFEKLQRLRDRVALRAPYQLLANEVRCELRRRLSWHPGS
uniref:Uncharacterized protein n=1 Tax=Schlesneria paludicola TaxID=360056 RepID=A0A7C2K1L9_9PLAN